MNRIVTMVLKNLLVLPGALWKLYRYARHPERYPELTKYRHIQYIAKRVIKAGNVTLQVTGLENIPTESGFMLYGNHQGMFDILAAIATCDQPMGAVMKIELKNVPVIKQFCACTKSFPMDRADVRQSLTVIQNVTHEVSQGRNYLIFPEGTRSKDNAMLEFHHGSFRCAVRSKCPVVPFAVVDSFKVLDQKGSKPVTVQIHYLPPIPYEEYQDMNTKELALMVHDRIEQKVKSCLQ